jgi:hypothetical protein
MGNDIETNGLLLFAAFYHCFQITHFADKDKQKYADKQ